MTSKIRKTSEAQDLNPFLQLPRVNVIVAVTDSQWNELSGPVIDVI